MKPIQLNDIYPYVITCTNVNEKNCPPRGTLYEERRVKWYELELILWGEGYIITKDIKIPVKKGDLLFRTPGMKVQGIPPYYCYLIVFDLVYSPQKVSSYAEPDCLNNILEVSDTSTCASEYDLPDVMNFPQISRLEDLFRNVYQHYLNDSRESQFHLRTYLMQILMFTYTEWMKVRVLQNPSRSILTNYPKVMEVRRYIDNNLQNRIRLQELADIAGLSPNFLCNIFKRIVGVNIIEYINDCKINSAKKILMDTNKCVKEISFDLGFENDTYFYTLFKKKEGLSPLEYRECHRQILGQ
ncbi:MAG TPA: AraC family transcriptional regulator [Ruminiclostridium sp.]